MKFRLFSIFIITSFFVTTSLAAQVPADLLFNNKPIDPLCFFNLEKSETIYLIYLNKCGLEKENSSIKSQNNDLIKNGFIGFEWQEKPADPNAHSDQGYSYYKFFNAGNHRYWIYSINSGGGSGEFTSIDLIKRKNNNTLALQTLGGGDRCNGGIQDVSEKDNNLYYSVNLTPYDFLPLVNDNPHHLRAYDDLPACAACCVAKAFYRLDVNDLKSKLQYVDLISKDNYSDKTSKNSYEVCFNKVFSDFINKNGVKADTDKLKKLVKEFNKQCGAQRAQPN